MIRNTSIAWVSETLAATIAVGLPRSIHANPLRSAVVAIAALAIASGSSLARPYQRAVGTPLQDTGLDIKYTAVASSPFAPGLVFAGYNQESLTGGLRDIIVGRNQMNGALNWGFEYGLANSDEAGYTITPVSDGFVVGFETNAVPPYGIGLMKLSHTGTVLSTILYNGTQFLDFPAGVSVRTTTNGEVLAVGRVLNTTSQVWNGVLIRAAAKTPFSPIFAYSYPFSSIPGNLSFTDVVELNDTSIGVSGTFTVRNSNPVQTYAIFGRFSPTGGPFSLTYYPLSGWTTTGDGIDHDPLTGNIVLSGRVAPYGSTAPVDTTMVWIINYGGVPQATFLYKGIVNGYQAVKYLPYPRVSPEKIVVSGSTPATTFPVSDAAMMQMQAFLGNPIWSMRYGSGVADIGHGAVAYPDSTGVLGGFALIGATDNPVLSPRDAYLVRTDAAGKTFCNEATLALIVSQTGLPYGNSSTSPIPMQFQFYEFPIRSQLATSHICPVCPPCVGDLNGDAFVDDPDFVIFAGCYDQFYVNSAACYCADLNHDDFVDDTDFVIFAAAYDQFICP